MFSNSFQSGDTGLEIFSPAGNDPFKIMKLQNESSIGKVYERTVKGYMITLDKESSTTCIQCPQKQKNNLGITQPLLVFQILFAASKSFSLEIIITDCNNQRRRLHFSTNFTVVDSNGLHCRVPWESETDVWMNLVLDLMVIVDETFKDGIQFQSLDSFTIHPVCRIRKIFTLPRKAIVDTNTVLIPLSFDFPPGVEHINHVYNIANNTLAVIKMDVFPKLSTVTTTSTNIAQPHNSNGLLGRNTNRTSRIDKNKKTDVISANTELAGEYLEVSDELSIRKSPMNIRTDTAMSVEKLDNQEDITAKVGLASTDFCLSTMELLLNRATVTLRHLEGVLSYAENAYIAKHGQQAFKLEVGAHEISC